MRFFVTTFFLLFFILCTTNFSHGAIIKKDVSHLPISLSASQIQTWDKNGTRVFVAWDVKIDQGEVQINADRATAWFTEVKIAQFTEGNMEIYCEGNVSLIQEGMIQNYKQIYLKLVTTEGVVISPTAHSPIRRFEEEQITGLYRQGEKIRAEKREEFATKEIPRVGAPASIAAEEGLIDIFADDIDSWEEKDVRVVVAIGNVRIKRGNETLNADNVIFYLDQEKGENGKPPKQTYKEFYAEGNVTLIREKDVIIADKIFENVKEKKGIFINSTISSALKPPTIRMETPVYIKGDEIKHTDEGRYDIKNGDFSLCSYGHPHYRFKYSKLRIIKSSEHSILTAKNNVFYIGNVPLMYLPYLNLDIKKRVKLLKEWETGRTSRFGRFFKTDWDVYSFAFDEKMGDWSDLTLSADFLELRGPAIGLDFDYKKPGYFGYMNTYYVRDEEDLDINNVPITTRDRGQFLWRHRQLLANDWTADIEISHVSDRSFFREYFEQEFKIRKDRETIFYLKKISENRGITFLTEHQLRTYDTLVDSVRLNRKNESLPELKYRIIGEPLWRGKLNLTSETELAYQNRMFDRISPLRAEERFLGRGASLTAERVFDRVPVRLEPEETIRFDTDNVLNAPFHILGIRFNPFIGARFTGYSESVKVDPVTLENEGGGTPRGRITGSLGLNISTTLSRTYSIYNKLLNINRLRHIMVPEVSFNFIPIVTQNPEDLNQFDGIDALDDYQAIKLSLRNRLQTKRGEPGKEESIDLVDFDIKFNFFPGTAGLNRKRDEFLQLDLRIKLTEKISIFSERNEFNLRKGGVDIANIGLSYSNMPKYHFFIEQRFIDNTSSSVRFSSSLSIGEKWRVAFYETFDFRSQQRDATGQEVDFESKSLSSSFNLTRFFHDWIAKIDISQIGTREDDNIVRFDIIPRGVGFITDRLRTFGSLLPVEEP